MNTFTAQMDAKASICAPQAFVTRDLLAGVASRFDVTSPTAPFGDSSMHIRTLTFVLSAVSLAGLAACGSDSATTVVPAAITYKASLSGANERPNPNTSAATGTATYTLVGNSLSYIVTVSGLTGPATASHIHVGSASVSGPVIVPYVTGSVASGNVTSGTIDLAQPVSNGTTSITGDSLKVLLNAGNAYTNVHTSQFGGGEIRGQIIKQ